MYDKAVHLGFIREEIRKAAEKSFSCRKWTMSILSVSALIFSAGKIPPDNYITGSLALTMLALILSFWYQDAESERERRKLAKLYDRVRLEDVSSDYDMSTEEFDTKVDGEFPIMFTVKLSFIYLPLFSFVYSVLKHLK